MKVENKIDFGRHQTGKMKHNTRTFDGKKYTLHQGFYNKELAIERMKSLNPITILIENLEGYTPFTVWVLMKE